MRWSLLQKHIAVGEGFLLLAGAFCLVGEEAPHHIRAAMAALEKGRSEVKAGHLSQGLEACKSAAQIEPTYTEAYECEIAADLKANHRLQAATTMTQLLEIDPELSGYRLQLAAILLAEGQTQRALAQYSFVLQRDQFNADAMLGFADAARKLGLNDRAQAILERGRKRYPGDRRFRVSDQMQK